MKKKVMWENYMAGITGACWYHDDLGWDILDPRAVASTAGEMRTLRTLRDFWDAVPRREFVVTPANLCVTSLWPSASAVHCLVRRNGSRAAEMILHVRRDESVRPSFQIVASSEPEHQYTYDASHNCWSAHGCENIDNNATVVADPQQCTRRCDADEECDCVVYYFPDHKCWRRKNCVKTKFVKMNNYRVYIKGPPKGSRAAATSGSTFRGAPLLQANSSWSGVWLDPASTDSRTVPFSAKAGDTVQQPPSIPHDAILRVIF